MEWDIKTRRKLAHIVKRKALAIQEDEFRNAMKSRLTFGEIIDVVDRRILEVLGPLGFQRAEKDWEHESHEEIMIFKPSKTHLWFETAQGRIIKISKKRAEKIVILGLP